MAARSKLEAVGSFSKKGSGFRAEVRGKLIEFLKVANASPFKADEARKKLKEALGATILKANQDKILAAGDAIFGAGWQNK